MKFLNLTLILVCLAACTGPRTVQEGRKELARLSQHAQTTTSEEAVKDGEAALKLMDLAHQNRNDIASRIHPLPSFALISLLSSTAHGQTTQGKESQASLIDKGIKSFKKPDLKSKMEAEDIVDSAEQDFMFEAFDESLKIFEIALKKDPKNVRAQLYIYYLRPFKLLKGLRWRTLNSDEENVKGFHNEYLRNLDPLNSDAESKFQLFLMTPYKTQIKYANHLNQEIIRPGIKLLVQSSEAYNKLSKNPNLNVTLDLPEVLLGMIPLRIRQGDLKMAESFALGMAIYLKHWTLYNAGEARTDITYEKDETQKAWNQLAKNPQFGVLIDEDFYSTIQDRFDTFQNSMQLAIQYLEQRAQRGLNDPMDAFQYTPVTIKSCEIMKTNQETQQSNAESFSQSLSSKYWYNCPNLRTIKLKPQYTSWREYSKRNQYMTNFQAEYEAHDSYAKAQAEYYEEMKKKYPTANYYAYKPGDSYNSVYQYFTPQSPLAHRQQLNATRRMLFGPEEIEVLCSVNVTKKKNVDAYFITTINFPAYFKNPMKDLKLQNPKFKSGQLKAVTDTTFNGLFPQGYPCLKRSR